MEDLSLHILDIAENAIRAKAKKIIIEISEDSDRDKLVLCIQDDGMGMNKDVSRKADDPFFTTKSGKKIGLGLSLLSQAAKDTGGTLKISSRQGRFTKIRAVFRPSHPDMKPIGDVLETLRVLIVSNPGIHFICKYKKKGGSFSFDSKASG